MFNTFGDRRTIDVLDSEKPDPVKIGPDPGLRLLSAYTIIGFKVLDEPEMYVPRLMGMKVGRWRTLTSTRTRRNRTSRPHKR